MRRPRSGPAHLQCSWFLVCTAASALVLITCLLARQLKPSERKTRLSHAECTSFPVPRRPKRFSKRFVDMHWANHNNSLTLISQGQAYRLPDYVNCPAAGSSSMATKHVYPIDGALTRRPFHDLPISVLDAACYAPGAARASRIKYRRARTQNDKFAHPHTAPTSRSNNVVCVVMRFYAGQLGEKARFNVDAALESLTKQHHTSFSILLVHTDASNVTAVHTVLRRLNDPRVRLVTFDDLEFTARVNHRVVWLATEKAITMCPENARWLLVTNGDNTYDPSFFNHLDDAYDVIAYDYHTRHRPSWARGECDAYGVQDGVGQGCLANNLRLCETDLGAVVLNLPRWRHEERRFSEHESYNGSEDGLKFEALVADGWLHKRVAGTSTRGCLFDHNPNYHSCLRLSDTTVWDDRAQQCVDTRDNVDAMRVAVRRHGPAERCLM